MILLIVRTNIVIRVVVIIIIMIIIINCFSLCIEHKASTKFHHLPLFKVWIEVGREEKATFKMNIRKIVCGVVSQVHVSSQAFVVGMFSLWVLIQ
jgi:hypothetical protein